MASAAKKTVSSRRRNTSPASGSPSSRANTTTARSTAMSGDEPAAQPDRRRTSSARSSDQLEDRPCEALHRRHARPRRADRRSYDLSRPRGRLRRAPIRSTTSSTPSLNPTVIIEVLSPSTEAWDRGGKFAELSAHRHRSRNTSSISQDKIRVERYSRQGDQWLLTTWDRHRGHLRLESIGCDVRSRDIYAEGDIRRMSRS